MSGGEGIQLIQFSIYKIDYQEIKKQHTVTLTTEAGEIYYSASNPIELSDIFETFKENEKKVMFPRFIR